ncbi:LysR family transcriptional regulator [Asaia sp. BMEF1]|uniref:LysR family transcriptional regulator n=1 Tax=Asaia sp. BMEF1 TaxID=3155932 RepID=UPI003F66E6A7
MTITTRPSLNDLIAFATVIEHRSFTRAAVHLGVSRSALSHTVQSLEQRLGRRLLNRTTRSVAPTEAGSSLLAGIGPVLESFDHALDRFSEAQGVLSGRLRINAGATAIGILLGRAVPVFLEQYPGVVLDLTADGRLVDIVAQGFDAGVRLADAVPQDMIAVPFGGPVRFIAVAAPSYRTDASLPQVPDDLRYHRCIGHRLPGGRLYDAWEFSKDGQDIVLDISASLVLDDIALMVEAACAGLGIAYVPEPAVRARLKTGRLVHLLAGWSPPGPGMCLYYAGHRRVPAALRAFIDVLREQGI